MLLALLVIGLAIVYAINQKRQTSQQQQRLQAARREQAETQLAHAQAQLDQYIDSLTSKNDLIERITTDLDRMTHPAPEPPQPLLDAQKNLTNASLLTHDDWAEFRRRFERVHPAFFEQLHAQISAVTPAEERLLALSKLNIDTRQMGRMLGISPSSVRTTKYRLRKRLGVQGQSPLLDLLD